MSETKVTLENEAAQSTNALGPLVGLAREDFVGAVALLLRETASDPGRAMRHARTMGEAGVATDGYINRALFNISRVGRKRLNLKLLIELSPVHTAMNIKQ